MLSVLSSPFPFLFFSFLLYLAFLPFFFSDYFFASFSFCLSVSPLSLSLSVSLSLCVSLSPPPPSRTSHPQSRPSPPSPSHRPRTPPRPAPQTISPTGWTRQCGRWWCSAVTSPPRCRGPASSARSGLSGSPGCTERSVGACSNPWLQPLSPGSPGLHPAPPHPTLDTRLHHPRRSAPRE